ncbi:hypothetical protein FTX61_19190 [Nitriliruptoraceae bacterium ZYF776]|nr:hypothetical protein [Profundirhabdus halotolerans]
MRHGTSSVRHGPQASGATPGTRASSLSTANGTQPRRTTPPPEGTTMATRTPHQLERPTGTPAEVELTLKPNRLFTLVAILAIVVGAGSILGGIAGATYTYQQAAVEQITTPDDAAIPGVPVRGPLSMWAQSDIITHHQLDATDGLRYAEMDRMVPQIDDTTGQPVLDDTGEPVMVMNEARNSWITATALTTVLGMGIMAYALAAFAIVVGLTLIALGTVVLKLRHTTLDLA